MDKKLPGIVVTGASGFVGRHFLEAAAGKYRLFCLARRSQKEAGIPAYENLRWSQVDIADWDGLRDVVRCIKSHGGADFVLHLAGYYDFSNMENPEYERTNVNGTRHILKLAKLLGVRRFIFASSLAACEFPAPGTAVTETTPPSARFPYAWSKRMGEKMIHDHAGWFPSTIVRMAAVYSDWCEYPPLYVFLSTWLSKKWNARILGGHGESAVTYIHINDLIKIFMRLFKLSDELPRICTFNASPGHTTSHLDLFKASTQYYFGQSVKALSMPKLLAVPGMAVRQLIGRLTGHEPFERLWMAKYIDKKLEVNSDATFKELDWRPTPRYDLKRRLLFLIENMKNHTDTWQLRNEAALNRVVQRPNLTIYTFLVEAGDTLIDEMIGLIREPSNKDRFLPYKDMDDESLRWYIRLLYQLIYTTIRTRDRKLILNYAQIIAYRRFFEGYDQTIVIGLINAFGDIISRYLMNRQDLKDLRHIIYDNVNLTFQIVTDEIEDTYDRLKSQSPERLESLKDQNIQLSVSSGDLERVIHQLEDICQDTLDERLPFGPHQLTDLIPSKEQG
ncbi:MAG: NAD-dependent epimerase/dehydratase family protein [Calditrichaceae bacterium]